MTFRDIKLPKQLAKKKKMELYKCYLLQEATPGESRELQLNLDNDRYGLSKEAAIRHAVNQLRFSDFSGESGVLETLKQYNIVILKIILDAHAIEEDILLKKVDGNEVPIDPNYDFENEMISVTAKDRVSDILIENYQLKSADITFNPSTEILDITNIELLSKVLNKNVTG